MRFLNMESLGQLKTIKFSLIRKIPLWQSKNRKKNTSFLNATVSSSFFFLSLEAFALSDALVSVPRNLASISSTLWSFPEASETSSTSVVSSYQ